MKNFENRVSELERPKSANPGTLTLESYLKKRAKNYFSEDDILILEDLSNQKNEALIAYFEMYEVNKNEEELVDTFSIILKKYKENLAKKVS